MAGGTIKSIAFTNAEGDKVSGKVATDKKSWTLTEDLGYGRTYKVSGVAVNSAGKTTPINGTLHHGVHHRADHHADHAG